MEGKPGRTYSDMAPGVEQVVYAGDTLVMRDNDGNEFAIQSKEHPDTLDFIKAFDAWLMVKQSGDGAPNNVVLDALWASVQLAYNNLPMQIQTQLPSFARAGVPLAGHDHA